MRCWRMDSSHSHCQSRSSAHQSAADLAVGKTQHNKHEYEVIMDYMDFAHDNVKLSGKLDIG